MSIFVNRHLSMRGIKAIGFDMDYTLVRYHSEPFEEFVFYELLKKLIEIKQYPECIKNLKFDKNKVIRGLVLDRKNGNLLKLSTWGKAIYASHGTKMLDGKTQRNFYKDSYIDISDKNFTNIDTAFSLAHACLFSYLVDSKDQGEADFPTYDLMERDIREMLDLGHRDGTFKTEVKNNFSKYVILDPDTVFVLERFKKFGKKLFLITNSEYEYTKVLMDYAFNPFLKDHSSWEDLFDISITNAAKPRFFEDNLPFFEIDEKTGMMKNVIGPLKKAIYQGGSARALQQQFNLTNNDILYFGDHIYGDIVALKLACDWRTALIVEELDKEIQILKEEYPLQLKIDRLRDKKIEVEEEINKKFEAGENTEELEKLLYDLNSEQIILKKDYQKKFNPYWGELMKSGKDISRFAGQLQRYACIYMSKVSDFKNYSPRHFFRSENVKLPHEL